MNWINAIQPQSKKLVEHLPMAVNLILIIALTHSLAMLTWNLIPAETPDSVAKHEKHSRKGVTRRMPQTKINTASISQWHLFGKYEPPAPVVVKPVEKIDLPVTNLNLTLTGIISSTRDSEAIAIIADSTREENFYRIGDLLPGNAVLKDIFDDYVSLELNGRLEILKLPKVADKGKTGSRRTASRSYQSKRNRVASISSDNADTRTLLRQYRETLVKDPQSLMDLVRARPVRENGKLIGYKIRPGRDRKLLRKFGLRSGDVVTAVNGIALDNPIKGLEIMRDLTTAGQVTLDIKRRGVPQSMSFQVD